MRLVMIEPAERTMHHVSTYECFICHDSESFLLDSPVAAVGKWS